METCDVWIEVELLGLCARSGCCSVASMFELVGINFDGENSCYVTEMIVFQLEKRCLCRPERWIEKELKM